MTKRLAVREIDRHIAELEKIRSPTALTANLIKLFSIVNYGIPATKENDRRQDRLTHICLKNKISLQEIMKLVHERQGKGYV
jgi:hypothetical protein